MSTITRDNPRPTTPTDSITVTPSNHRHLISLPPRDFLPEAVLEAHDAYQEQLGKWSELEGRLTSAEADLAEADRKDRQATLDAVRNGNDPAKVGTPHRDVVLQDQRTLLYREEAARTVTYEAKRRLLAAMHAVQDGHLADLATELDRAADAYAEHAAAFLQARRKYRWLRDQRTYWNTIDDRPHGPRWPAPISAGIEPEHDALAEVIFALRNAADTDARGIPEPEL